MKTSLQYGVSAVRVGDARLLKKQEREIDYKAKGDTSHVIEARIHNALGAGVGAIIYCIGCGATVKVAESMVRQDSWIGCHMLRIGMTEEIPRIWHRCV